MKRSTYWSNHIGQIEGLVKSGIGQIVKVFEFCGRRTSSSFRVKPGSSFNTLSRRWTVHFEWGSCFKSNNEEPMTRFREGLVFKACRLVYHSTLGLKVIKKKKIWFQCQEKQTLVQNWSKQKLVQNMVHSCGSLLHDQSRPTLQGYLA